MDCVVGAVANDPQGLPNDPQGALSSFGKKSSRWSVLETNFEAFKRRFLARKEGGFVLGLEEKKGSRHPTLEGTDFERNSGPKSAP